VFLFTQSTQDTIKQPHENFHAVPEQHLLLIVGFSCIKDSQSIFQRNFPESPLVVGEVQDKQPGALSELFLAGLLNEDSVAEDSSCSLVRSEVTKNRSQARKTLKILVEIGLSLIAVRLEMIFQLTRLLL